MLHALIMAGGGGTRFWPRSRQKKPKQFLTLTGTRSLLQMAIDRIESQVPAERTWVITAMKHRAEASRQLEDLAAERIVGEPCGRDTAACIGLGAALIAREDPSAIMLVMPADHVIEPVQAFRQAVHAAEQLALENGDALITFGISPTFAATGYGYIQRGEPLSQIQGVRVFTVQAFREKPGPTLAEEFVASGHYYWNSGLFVWRASTILRHLAERQPRIYKAVERIASAWGTESQNEVFQQKYEDLERLSIDYAVMEQARDVLVIEAPFRWDDVGSWLALERMNPQDAEGNTVMANHTGLNTRNCVIVSDPEHLVATVGVDNLLIIQDGDTTLVANRSDEGAVKQLVEQLKTKGLEKYL
jgi:mannose-1-phosphate guanylyltransferase